MNPYENIDWLPDYVDCSDCNCEQSEIDRLRINSTVNASYDEDFENEYTHPQNPI